MSERGGILLHHQGDVPYFVQDKSGALDPFLSLAATGLLSYLLALPEGSPISSDAVADAKGYKPPKPGELVDLQACEKTRGSGREAVQTAYNELITRGYVRRFRAQNPTNGQWATYVEVSDRRVFADEDAPPPQTRHPRPVPAPESANSQVSPKTGEPSPARPAETRESPGQPEDGSTGAGSTRAKFVIDKSFKSSNPPTPHSGAPARRNPAQPRPSRPSKTAERRMTAEEDKLVERVYAAWRSKLPKDEPGRRGKNRTNAILDLLRAGVPVEDLEDAVRGWRYDPWEQRKYHYDIPKLLGPGTRQKMRDLWRRKHPRHRPAPPPPARQQPPAPATPQRDDLTLLDDDPPETPEQAKIREYREYLARQQREVTGAAPTRAVGA